jgi:multidrug efflux system outer membrane protein
MSAALMPRQMGTRTALLGLAGLCVIGACTLEPHYTAPPLPVADAWPIPATTSPAASAVAAADIGWRDFFVDARLQALIAQALANNRDLRIAILNVESAQALYRIQRAQQLPNINATGNFTKQRLPPALSDGFPSAVYQDYEVGLGLAAFEIDLFGRVRSLSHVALEQYLAQQETRRGAQLSLIAAVTGAYLTLATDHELQHLAAETLKSQQDSFDLTQKRHAAGGASALDLAQSQTTVETARADAAHYDGSVAQDLDALTLLLGGAPDPSLLPESFDALVASLTVPAAGLPSTVLLRRPDVLAAEHQVRAANGNIGAVRAAFFPIISLMGNFGSASEGLSGLFKAGTGAWTFAPQVTLPLFAGGRNVGGLAEANAQQRIAIASYEKAVQAAFRDVADALALSTTLARERQADEALAQSTAVAFDLAQQRYKAGRDSYLNVLDAQRSDYAARQRLIAVRLTEQNNLVSLYTALGGGWLEHSAAVK